MANLERDKNPLLRPKGHLACESMPAPDLTQIWVFWPWNQRTVAAERLDTDCFKGTIFSVALWCCWPIPGAGEHNEDECNEQIALPMGACVRLCRLCGNHCDGAGAACRQGGGPWSVAEGDCLHDRLRANANDVLAGHTPDSGRAANHQGNQSGPRLQPNRGKVRPPVQNQQVVLQ
jgi:hypothetical protein